ncbi:hypothetical protein GGR28_002407 [Lewinella aquimaris]|uniref:Uncharacterized protein n=1 Tax=Neolewinella aquimaris TaxID=1835722 RepID=A0A840E3X5_9BACT|nr:hypothetical protein [Neolewinella aquimaris]MBB4079780.1 hypothetical protein [Neolewinella aquimaris]
MKRLLLIPAICCLSMLLWQCEKAEIVLPEEAATPASLSLDTRASAGATQISGIGFFAEPTDCDIASEGADYAIQLTGDLEGCLFVFVENFACSPSGTYRESGREYFVGTYNGEEGTFWTNYKFSGKYEGCNDDGTFSGAEIFGRCQHPIERGTGTGVFAGVRGRLDFKDDVEAGNFPFRGHLKY